MEEEKVISNTGVETEEVAVPEISEGQTSEPEAVTATESEPNESPQETPFVEKAFAARLAKQVEKERKRLESEYSQYKRLAEVGAKQYDMPVEEYIKSFFEEAQESAQEEPVTITPEDREILNQLKEEKSIERTKKEEEAYWLNQGNELKKYGVKSPSDVPNEVWERMIENGTELVFEYLKFDKEQAIKQAQADTIRKLQEQESPGSLSGNMGVEFKSIKDLPYDSPEFKKYTEDVIHGRNR